ncbi:MAG: LamG domain-containing protein, partial [Planctomycetota bacterium]
QNCILWNNRLGDLSGCSAEYSWVEEERDANIVSYWKFDEGSGTTGYDSVGNNDAIIYGATWITGQINGALGFDGLDDYVDLSSTVQFDDEDFTITGWFRTSSNTSGTYEQIWISGYQTVGGEDLEVAMKNNGLYFYAREASGTYVSQGAGIANDGLWHHFAALRSGNNFLLYLDGVLASSASEALGDLDEPGVVPRIGNGIYTVSDRFFNGSIDGTAIYDRALSALEVERLYKQGLAGHEYIDPVFADANSGDYHLKSERGRYRATTDEWLLDWVTSDAIDGGDPMVEPANERMPNGGRINMGAYGNTPYASMSEGTLVGDTNGDGIVNFVDFGILADEWLSTLPWME